MLPTILVCVCRFNQSTTANMINREDLRLCFLSSRVDADCVGDLSRAGDEALLSYIERVQYQNGTLIDRHHMK